MDSLRPWIKKWLKKFYNDNYNDIYNEFDSINGNIGKKVQLIEVSGCNIFIKSYIH